MIRVKGQKVELWLKRSKLEGKWNTFNKAYFWGNPPPIRNSIPVRVINNLQGEGKGDSVEEGREKQRGKKNG